MDAKPDAQKTRKETDEAAARRQFLKKVGTASVTAPAVALLLAATSTSASAQQISRRPA